MRNTLEFLVAPPSYKSEKTIRGGGYTTTVIFTFYEWYLHANYLMKIKKREIRKIFYFLRVEDAKYRKLLASLPFLIAKNRPKMAVFSSKQCRADS